MKTMKSQAVLQEIYADHCVKQLAGQMNLGVSTVHKWAESCDPNAVSPVERTGALLECLGEDDRLIQHLCQRAGGVFVRNAPAREAGPDLLAALCAVELAFMVTLQSLVNLALSRCLSVAAAAVVRRHWEKQKSVTEGFMQACERGAFHGGALLWAFVSWSLGSDALELAVA